MPNLDRATAGFGIGAPLILLALERRGVTIPDWVWVCIGVLSVGAVLYSLVIWVIHAQTWLAKRGKRQLLPILTMFTGVAIVIAGFAWYIAAGLPDPFGWQRATAAAPPKGQAAPPTVAAPIPTLRELFDTDFENTLRHARDVNVENEPLHIKVTITRKTYADFAAQAVFTGFYIPRTTNTAFICVYLATQWKGLLAESRKEIAVEAKDPGDSAAVTLNDLTPTGRVYIYYEDELTLRQMADIEEAFQQNGAKVILRGRTYQISRWTDRQIKALKVNH